MELYSEVRQCMKPFLVALTLLLETMNRPGLRRLGRGTLMGNKEHKLQVNLELTHLKRKVKSRVCLRFLSETRGIIISSYK